MFSAVRLDDAINQAGRIGRRQRRQRMMRAAALIVVVGATLAYVILSSGRPF